MVRKSLEASTDEGMEIVKRQVPIPREEFEYLYVALGDPNDPRPSPAIEDGLAIPSGIARGARDRATTLATPT